MKKFLLAALLALTPAAYVAVPVVALTACKTSNTTIAYRSIGSLETAVETALTVWTDHVASQLVAISRIADRSQQTAATQALNDKRSKAKAALLGYQTAMAAARIAVDSALVNNTDPAPAPVLAAGNNFITTVASLAK